MEGAEVIIDVDVMEWTVAETRLYRQHVGVNPEYALGMLQQAALDSQAEMREKFGDEDPPDGYLPLPLLNIDPGYLLGFAWVVARRSEPALGFEAYSGRLHVGELMRAFYDMAAGASEDPLAETAETQSAETPSSSSASSTAGD